MTLVNSRPSIVNWFFIYRGWYGAAIKGEKARECARNSQRKRENSRKSEKTRENDGPSNLFSITQLIRMVNSTDGQWSMVNGVVSGVYLKVNYSANIRVLFWMVNYRYSVVYVIMISRQVMMIMLGELIIISGNNHIYIYNWYHNL